MTPRLLITRCVTVATVLAGCLKPVVVPEPLPVAPHECAVPPAWEAVEVYEPCPLDDGVCLDKANAAKLARQVTDLREWARRCRRR